MEFIHECPDLYRVLCLDPCSAAELRSSSAWSPELMEDIQPHIMTLPPPCFTPAMMFFLLIKCGIVCPPAGEEAEGSAGAEDAEEHQRPESRRGNRWKRQRSEHHGAAEYAHMRPVSPKPFSKLKLFFNLLQETPAGRSTTWSSSWWRRSRTSQLWSRT